MSARKRSSGKVTVRVADRCVFYVDDVAYLAGQELELDADEAAQAIESGIVVDPESPPTEDPPSTDPATSTDADE